MLQVMDRLDGRCGRGRDFQISAETGWLLLTTPTAYLAHPKTLDLAALVCRDRTSSTRPCEPLCRRRISTASDVGSMYRGEEKAFDSSDWDEPAGERCAESDTRRPQCEHMTAPYPAL